MAGRRDERQRLVADDLRLQMRYVRAGFEEQGDIDTPRFQLLRCLRRSSHSPHVYLDGGQVPAQRGHRERQTVGAQGFAGAEGDTALDRGGGVRLVVEAVLGVQ
ncbi:hypothetical protein ADK76_04815 [Streptomyces griseoflavus]|nr:hypothetical protein ADK76_04815 [Streptomyces griseoflavus]